MNFEPGIPDTMRRPSFQDNICFLLWEHPENPKVQVNKVCVEWFDDWHKRLWNNIVDWQGGNRPKDVTLFC